MSADRKVPEIRFKGFSGGWKNSELHELALFNPKNELPESFNYVDLESVKGTSLIGYRVEIKNKAPSRAQRLAQKGDVFYQTVRPYQKNNYLFNEDGDDYVFSTGYAQLRPYCDGHFLLNLVQRDPFVKQVLDNCTGTSYPAINAFVLATLEVSNPEIEAEQTQIGNYFQKLDTLINQHQKKHDKLCNIKKAMLEKMFPKQGETIPEIRFRKFSGEWKSDILESVVSFYKGKNLPKSSIQDDGVFPCIHYGELFTKYSEVIEVVTSRTNQNDNFFSISNDVLMPTSDVTPKGLVKSCCIKQSGVVLGGDILIIRPEDKNVIDGAFLSRFIRSREQQVLQNVTGTTVFHLYASSIEKLDIVFPFIEEQNAISNYFQKLDNLINQHQQQITKLNNIKQACLSKMFV
ncbi:restriction endonuclease subunit S [uncultured Gilliamella sp.]|uniref:restriction endonuclease subunit S n=1 Tax=uncultured Gilliamella sp. TaxID=1193505 RepID=UPI0025E00687|nr:restriction endonuclease subunit S [uncultured Gilliamella sp.]